MSYPNVPLGTSEWQRKSAQATNYLLNVQEYVSIEADGIPSAGQELLSLKFPFPVTINVSQSGLACDVEPTSSAVFSFKIGGATAGTGAIPAGQKTGTISLTTNTIPAWTRFQVFAPAIADATLSDITLALAIG